MDDEGFRVWELGFGVCGLGPFKDDARVVLTHPHAKSALRRTGKGPNAPAPASETGRGCRKSLK